jgi:hypothetical protein
MRTPISVIFKPMAASIPAKNGDGSPMSVIAANILARSAASQLSRSRGGALKRVNLKSRRRE